MPPALRNGPGDLRQPGERAPGAGIEILRGTPRMFERLHHHPLGRRGIDEQTIDLSVQRETVALGKLLVCAAVTCSHALHESNVRRRPTSHSEPRQRTSARLVVDELRRLRDSTPARLGVEAGSPAGNVERLALPGAGEMLLDCPITVRSVDRIMLALVPIELEETMTPIPPLPPPRRDAARPWPGPRRAPPTCPSASAPSSGSPVRAWAAASTGPSATASCSRHSTCRRSSNTGIGSWQQG